MKFLLLLNICGLFVLMSCKQNAHKPKSIKDGSIICFGIQEKQGMVNSIFNNNYILNHMDPRVSDSTLPLKILTNNIFRKSDSIQFRKNKIAVLDSSDLTDDTYRIRIDNLDCTDKKFDFIILYPIEGKWYAKGKVYYSKDKWVTEIVSGGIAD